MRTLNLIGDTSSESSVDDAAMDSDGDSETMIELISDSDDDTTRDNDGDGSNNNNNITSMSNNNTSHTTPLSRGSSSSAPRNERWPSPVERLPEGMLVRVFKVSKRLYFNFWGPLSIETKSSLFLFFPSF